MRGITTIASLPAGSGRAGALLPEVGVRVEEKTAPSALEQFDALTSPDMQPKPMTFADVAESLPLHWSGAPSDWAVIQPD